MNKEIIFKPAKTFGFGLKQLKMAVRELGLETAEEIGIELLKVDGIYYVVKYINNTGPTLVTVNSADATERVTPAQLMSKVGA